MPEYDVTAIRFGPSLNFEVYIPEGRVTAREGGQQTGKESAGNTEQSSTEQAKETVLGLIADLG